MRFSELENVRVRLDEKGKKEFWKVLNEFGGVTQFSSAFGIQPSKMYNWKSKNSYLPIEIIKRVFGNEGSKYVEAYKGGGRSKPIEKPVFPIPENSELLTRIECSVTVNRKGIPTYQVSDIGLAQRFVELLNELGNVPIKIYDRNIYELRYPKYLHQILTNMSFEKNIEALVDEKARFENGEILLNEERIDSDKIESLYHKDKRLKLALMKEDNIEITKLMSEEKEKVRKALNQA